MPVRRASIDLQDNAGNVIETHEPAVLVILLRTSTQTGEVIFRDTPSGIHPVMELQIVQQALHHSFKFTLLLACPGHVAPSLNTRMTAGREQEREQYFA